LGEWNIGVMEKLKVKPEQFVFTNCSALRNPSAFSKLEI
jgi:hypothetical protein